MTYARARLWLGISGVGFFVTLSAAALYLNLPERLLGTSTPLTAIALTLAAYIVLSSPFDLLGGYLLPRRFHRTEATFPVWLRSWLQGILIQALIMGSSAAILLEAARRGGLLAALAILLVLMIALIQAQLPVARVVGNLSPARTLPPTGVLNPKHPATLVYTSTDPAFVGGLVGLPGSEQLVLPSRWLTSLSPEAVFMQITRRRGALASGARTRGVTLALAWNLAGFTLASQLPHANLASAPGLIGIALWFTLWSFLGLLLLPSLNRPGVLEADSFAAQSGIPAASIHQAMTALDRLQDDEPKRSRWIERVFHPIPSVESRMAALTQQPPTFGAWQGARMTLYLSWACFGLLSRAVHCNSGRPELWVLFPGD